MKITRRWQPTTNGPDGPEMDEARRVLALHLARVQWGIVPCDPDAANRMAQVTAYHAQTRGATDGPAFVVGALVLIAADGQERLDIYAIESRPRPGVTRRAYYTCDHVGFGLAMIEDREEDDS